MIRSLGLRIQVWNALILAVVIGVLGAMLYFQQRNSAFRSIDEEMRAAVAVLAGKLQAASPRTLRAYLNKQLNGEQRLGGSYRDGDGQGFAERRPGPPSRESDDQKFPEEGRPARRPSGRGPGGSSRLVAKLDQDLSIPNTFHPNRMSSTADRPYFLIWFADGQEIKKSTDVAIPIPSIPKPDKPGLRNPPQQETTFRWRGTFREAWTTGAPETRVLVGRNVERDIQRLSTSGWWMVLSGATAWLVGLAGGWLLSRGSTKPIEAISQVAADISGNNMAERIDVAKMDVEFVGLSQTLNNTFSRLQTAFERQRRFTADASHELRTPLSVLQTHQQLALSKPRSEEEYRQTLQTCERAVARMNSLVESLLMLARFDSDSETSNFSDVDLTELMQGEIDKLELVAARKRITFNCALGSATVRGDHTQLGQLVCNLLTNAIQYSPAKGNIRIELTNNDDQATIAITDDGTGIPAGDLERIFDRFYRVSKDRSRESGGSGLGLAICKSIIVRHGGSISVESTVGQGSTFLVTLPTGP